MIPRTMIALLLTLAATPALADDKDTSGDLETWQVTKDGGEALGTESLRVVHKDSGTFASGELKATLGKKKMHRKTHLQRGSDGHIDKYQRVESGLKGAGLKIFAYEGQMRIAPMNAPGKPTPLPDFDAERVWDVDLWHLYALWSLPKVCEMKRVSYFDPEKKAAAEATLTCTGKHEVYDAKKQGVAVHTFQVSGVPNEIELWVGSDGRLVGAKAAGRWMLKAKWDWTADAAGTKVSGDGKAGDDDDEEKVDRGIGE